ncbi:MAG: hypothetical protein BHW65_03420 [Verrucomicrobia bacterium CAG:312_58_20]|nr:MAG: hypothetical protein BHW65_03420 [Verrucomicrobia bacterium CAG:312_58_20]
MGVSGGRAPRAANKAAPARMGRPPDSRAKNPPPAEPRPNRRAASAIAAGFPCPAARESRAPRFPQTPD